MSYASLAVAGVGAVSSIVGFLGSKKKTPKYDYAGATKDLETYTGQANSLYDNLNTNVDAERVDATQAGNQAINWNMSQAGNFQSLASTFNKGAVEDRMDMLGTISPQWERQRDSADKANMAMMKGEVPLDVQQQMARTSAYKSFNAGYSGSPSGRQGTLARDLGLTSLGLVQQGQSNAQDWLKTTSAIAMPSQVSASDIMGNLGVNATMTAGVMGANANRELEADKMTSDNKFKVVSGRQGILDTNLEVRNAIRSQRLTDKWGQHSQKQAGYAALTSGIGGSVAKGLGSYFGAK
jgi:hypothetical protein